MMPYSPTSLQDALVPRLVLGHRSRGAAKVSGAQAELAGHERLPVESLTVGRGHQSELIGLVPTSKRRSSVHVVSHMTFITRQSPRITSSVRRMSM
jgi:hypothetical protein